MPESKKTKKELIDELDACRTSLVAHLEKAINDTGQENDPLLRECDFFQTFINDMAEPILVIDTDFKVKYANKAARQLSGEKTPPEPGAETCYKLLFNFDSQCDHKGQKCLLSQVIKEKKDVSIDKNVTLKNGEEKIYEIHGSPIWKDDGSLLGMVTTLRDVSQQRAETRMLESGHDFLEIRVQDRITDLIDLNSALRQEIIERQEAENRLRQALEQAELIYKVSPCAIFTVNKNKEITSWNNKIEEITGYSYEEIQGKKCDIICPAKTCRLFSDETQKPFLNHECRMRAKDGRILIISKNADLLYDPKGNVIGGIESFEDITQRKKMEEALRSERDKFMGIIAATRQGLHILNSNYEIEFQNDVLKNIFGDKLGHKCFEVYKKRTEPCEDCRMRSVIQHNRIEHTEDILFKDRHYSQSYAPFTDVDGRTKCLVFLRDVTVEKQNRAKTIRTAQLASIGELAAGVAHEINNPINGIINYAQIVLDDNQDTETINSLLPRIISEGERIADIAGKLLSFARQGDDDSQLFSETYVPDVVDNSLALVRHQLIKDGINIAEDIEHDTPPVWVHPQHLEQVFINLLSNARYALNEKFTGIGTNKKIELKINTVEVAGKTYVRTSIKDYGIGIPAEIIQFICNPFFSTKKSGEGTGLGLSISQGLIKNFNGFIRIESESGEYTNIMVDLPVFKGNKE